MIETASSSVVAAEDRTDEFSFASGNDRGGRIAFQKTLDTFPGIVDTADGKAFDAHPEIFDFIVVFDGHGVEGEWFHSCSFFR